MAHRFPQILPPAAISPGALALALAVAAMPAHAQTTPPPADTPAIAPAAAPPAAPNAADVIVVTGSRIAQKAVTDQPVQIVTGANISALGYTNIGQALTTLPGFGVPGNSPVGTQGSFGAGQTFVNLYDLGAQRTLTLVNGTRFVSSATSSIFGAVQGSPVDLGQIPPALVDRIDVVSVGGAPIYGSDAIAGTVNVVLKKNYQGVEIDGSSGISGNSDALDYNGTLLAGTNFAGGRGNIVLSVYYDHQDGLSTAERTITSSNGPFTSYNGSKYQLYQSGGLHYSVFTNTGMPLAFDDIPIYRGQPYASITNAAGQALVFNNAGHLVPFQDGTALRNGITEVGGGGFPIDDFGNLLTPSHRLQGTLLGHYDLTDHIHAHGELWLSRDSAANVADQPYYNTALFNAAGGANGNLVLSANNPYLSAADRATIASNLAPGQDTFYLARANTDLETGSFRSTTDLYRLVGGLDGDFRLGERAMSWDVTVNYGHGSTDTTQRELVTQNFYNALNATTDGSGNIVCAPGYTSASIATLSSTCAPLDIFGLGNESKAALDYVTAIARTHQVDTQLDIVADVKGDLVTLPAGAAKFVLGYEHRRESQSFDPGAFYRGELQPDGTYNQYGNSIPITPVAGAYHTDEGFGELNVPLIGADMHIPAVHSLALNGAARYTKNSLTGGFWSYTGGGTYAPIGALTFRGNYTRSFRSPSVTELFAPNGSTFETADDPCDASFISGGANPAVRAKNCAAAGIPAGFISNVVNYTVAGSQGGNTHLQNELANSWTAGGVLQPHRLPGFSLSADYVSIDIRNEITSPGLTNEMEACYDSSDYPNNAFCKTFTRDAGGQVTSYTDNYSNIAVEHFRALQATMQYKLPLARLGLPDAAGALNLSASYLHTFSHYTKTGEGDAQQVVNKRADPQDSVVANVDWQTNHVDWLWTVTYYGPTDVDPDNYDAYQYPKIDAYWMADTSIGYKLNDHVELRLVVNNVFDLGVPFPYAFSTSKYFDAIMGRYLRASAKIRF